jgi:putative PIN family toxin of toxin-antitoxin system
VIRATADSNIYISALQFGGVPLAFLNAARRRAFHLAISGALVEEIRGVLEKKFHWPNTMLYEAVSTLHNFCEFVTPAETLNVVLEDPDDDRVLKCAKTSQSQFIISGDKHLLRLGRYENIQIVRVADFLSLIPSPEPK